MMTFKMVGGGVGARAHLLCVQPRLCGLIFGLLVADVRLDDIIIMRWCLLTLIIPWLG